MKSHFKNNYLLINLALLATLMFTTVFAQLEELSPILGLEELNKLSGKGGRPNLSEMEDVESYVDIEDLNTLQKLKEERIKELIKRQIEELENPKIIQRPVTLDVLPMPKLIDQDLQYFGYELFYNAPTTFTPLKNMPVSQNHILGPGDNIKVILFGIINDEYTLKITREGYAFFPEIGPIPLGGFSFIEAKKNSFRSC
jgi:hypothetical protein